jgi:hypothetical protein
MTRLVVSGRSLEEEMLAGLDETEKATLQKLLNKLVRK